MRDSLLFSSFSRLVALGYADVRHGDPDLPMIILSVMVVLVSLGLGAGEQPALYAAQADASSARFVRIRGTLLFSALGARGPGFSLTDCLAVGSGFGYYSLSSVRDSPT